MLDDGPVTDTLPASNNYTGDDDIYAGTYSSSATGRMTVAMDYMDDAAETLVTLDINVLSSTGSGSWDYTIVKNSTTVWTNLGGSYPPSHPGPFGAEFLTAEVTYANTQYTGAYTQSVSVATELIFTTPFGTHNLPFHTFNSSGGSTYTRTRTETNNSEGTDLQVSDTSSRTYSHNYTQVGGGAMLEQNVRGFYSTIDLRLGMFVYTGITSVVSHSAGTGLSNQETRTCTREDKFFDCRGVGTLDYLLPQVTGVNTSGRPAYTDSWTITGIGPVYPNQDLTWNPELQVQYGIQVEDHIGVDAAGKLHETKFNEFAGPSGTLAYSPENQTVLFDILSSSVETHTDTGGIDGSGWTQGYAFPYCKQAVYFINLNEGQVVPLTPNLWEGNLFGNTATVNPTDLAVFGTVEWAGSIGRGPKEEG
jgi:hypothetical protein